MKDKENIKTSFDALKEDNPFKAPDGYFESFASKVQDKIHAQKKSLFEQIITALKPQVALATVFVTAMLVIFVAKKLFIPSNDFNTDEFADQYAWMLEDLSEEDILSLNFNETEVDEEEYEEEILNYLLNEGIETDQILNEF